MDKSTWLGLLLGFGAIFVGNLIEGGHVGSLLQFTAAFIVLGGTIGATMISNSQKDLRRGFFLFKSAFREEEKSWFRSSMTDIVDSARLARRETLLALEPRLARLSDPFVAKIIRHVIDGVPAEVIRDIGETEIAAEEEESLAAVKVWSDAGGFAPTVGIIGAVLGLIHVMGNLSDTSKLGAGIAVAFVATVYGVGFANLLFLPVSNKLKKRVQRRAREREVLLDGAILVGSELNPLIIEQKLKAALEAPAA